ACVCMVLHSWLVRSGGGDMIRKHWTHRMPRTAAKWALVAILVPFLLVGCVSLDKARQLFDAASQVCEIVDSVRQCMHN
ncbi:hypothetical protein MXM22_26820, partial [Escherichia coli]|nr:hypothetical protein [Escherichia coli]